MSELDVFIIFASSALSVVLGALGAYVMLKRYLKFEVFMEIFDAFTDEISTNKELQQKIYMTGAILGQGIKGGLGLTSQGRGKFKMEDILGLAIQQFLPGVLNKLGGASGAETISGQPAETSQGVVSPYG